MLSNKPISIGDLVMQVRNCPCGKGKGILLGIPFRVEQFLPKGRCAYCPRMFGKSAWFQQTIYAIPVERLIRIDPPADSLDEQTDRELEHS